MCDCTVDSDVGTSDFLLVLGILQVSAHVHVRSYVSPGMDCGEGQSVPLVVRIISDPLQLKRSLYDSYFGRINMDIVFNRQHTRAHLTWPYFMAFLPLSPFNMT